MSFTALISSCEVSKFHAAMRQAYAVPILGADKFERNKILKERKRALLRIVSLRRTARTANLVRDLKVMRWRWTRQA